MKAASAKEDFLKPYQLSEFPVEVRVSSFKTNEANQVRDIWPSRMEGKKSSLKAYGWFSGECAHAIADAGVTVSSDRKLVLGPDVNMPCLGPFDGSHRIKAALILERDEPNEFFLIPTMIYASTTPVELWRRAGFARMEINHFCDPYSTIDLLRLIDITVTEQKLDVSEPLKVRADNMYFLLYGVASPVASPVASSLASPVASTLLTVSNLEKLLAFHEMLKNSNQFELVVRILGARDHSSTAKSCNDLLGNGTSDDECFKEGACFLAPFKKKSRSNLVPFGSRYTSFFQEKQRAILPDGKMKELFLWAYGSWLLSGGTYPSVSDWTATSTRIRSEVRSDLDKLYEVHGTAPITCELFTLEILAAQQPGLLKKAAIKLGWAALLAKDLTGSRNSVVVVYIVAVRYYDYIMIYFFCSWCSG